MQQETLVASSAAASRLEERRKTRFQRIRPASVIVYLILFAGSLLTITPFFWMLTSAFKLPQEVISYPPVWFPTQPTMQSIIYVWERMNFARSFANSVFVSTTVTAIVLLTSATTGYVLAKYDFRGRNVVFVGILATMMIPWPVTLIPNYQLMVWFKMLNTYWALIMPSLYSAFGIFLMRQFMHSIPNELLDAGRIDGASEPRIFGQIVIPLIKPALAALAIFVFQWNWDNFIWPLIVLNDQRLYTLPVALGTFQSDNVIDYSSIMAGAAITVLPMVVVYLIFQRYFVTGIALTGLKG